MHGDFARVSFNPANRFTRVLAQQGRMLLEADLNEQTALHIHYLRSLIIDTIGRCWRAGDGFTLSKEPSDGDFAISAGRLYVDGIMCELAIATTYSKQPFWPVPGADPNTSDHLPDSFMIYAEVHERHLSAVQMPALREIALAGRDTATRAQVAWQIRLIAKDDVIKLQKQFKSLAKMRKVHPEPYVYKEGDIDAFLLQFTNSADDLVNQLDAAPGSSPACDSASGFMACWDQIGPLMRARARTDSLEVDPCAMPADAQFRSRENQLYRVEIHRGGSAEDATFKWSRENGSIEFAILSVKTADGTITAVIDTLGHDRRTGLCEGDWVELTSDAFEFAEATPPLGQITAIDRARRTLTIRSSVADVAFDSCTLLRRWDQSLGTAPNLREDGTLPVQESREGRWTPLERGVQVQFAQGGYYRTGDYWLIPARVETNDVIWPRDPVDAPAAVPPHGIARHRGVLGFGAKSGRVVTFTDCCCTISPQCAP